MIRTLEFNSLNQTRIEATTINPIKLFVSNIVIKGFSKKVFKKKAKYGYRWKVTKLRDSLSISENAINVSSKNVSLNEMKYEVKTFDESKKERNGRRKRDKLFRW